jgi:phosphopantothenate---cysteine ligase (ATP)
MAGSSTKLFRATARNEVPIILDSIVDTASKQWTFNPHQHKPNMEHDEVPLDVNRGLDLLSALTAKQVLGLKKQLEEFLADQDALQPLCIVSSGGTAVDLEVNAVRHLENFSTGLRGAISVEEFLKRGYAVIHLWRNGSASPFARFLNQELLGVHQADHAVDGNAMDKLFGLEGDDDDDDLVQTVLDQDNSMARRHGGDGGDDNEADRRRHEGPDVRLRCGIRRSTALKELLAARREAVRNRKILTIPFRTVNEYLAQLQVCSLAVNDFNSFTMFYLAAAVSDFYVPLAEKSEHKIQSSSGDGGLHLHLKPVPKTLGKIRSDWAPKSFVVSFKLETDETMLRKKAEQAVKKYGCHMVIGNLLHNRHKRVSILSPVSFQDYFPGKVEEWPMAHVEKHHDESNALESSIVDFVVQAHFEYISHTFGADTTAMSASQRRIAAKKEKVKRDRFWDQVKRVGTEVFGAILAVTLSYAINTALQRRLQARR